MPRHYFSEDFYELIYKLANDSIIVIEREKQEIVVANPKTCEMYGYSESELNGLPLSLLNADSAGKFRFLMSKLAASKDGYSYQTKHRKKSGEVLDVEVNSRLFTNRNKEFLISIIRDITDKKQFERDLEMAKAVQDNLLPQISLRYSKFNFTSFYRPLIQVTGDMYDLIPLDDKRVAVLLADVMGHGTAAALYTAAIKLFFRDKIRKCNFPSEFLSKLNRYFGYNTAEIDIFMGVICLIFDSRTSSVVCACGGINEFFFASREKNQFRLVQNAGPYVGMFADSQYADFGLRLASGDRIYLFTDGLLDLQNSEQNQDLCKLWEQLILDDQGLSAQELFAAYQNSLLPLGFAEQPFRDDLTLLKIECV